MSCKIDASIFASLVQVVCSEFFSSNSEIYGVLYLANLATVHQGLCAYAHAGVCVCVCVRNHVCVREAEKQSE